LNLERANKKLSNAHSLTGRDVFLEYDPTMLEVLRAMLQKGQKTCGISRSVDL